MLLVLISLPLGCGPLSFLVRRSLAVAWFVRALSCGDLALCWSPVMCHMQPLWGGHCQVTIGVPYLLMVLATPEHLTNVSKKKKACS